MLVASGAPKVSKELKTWIFISNFPSFKYQKLISNYLKLLCGLLCDPYLNVYDGMFVMFAPASGILLGCDPE